MSNFLAEAQVLIRPNTAGFRELLVAEVNAAVLAAERRIKAVNVPVAIGAGGVAIAAEQAAAVQAAGAAAQAAAIETQNLARAQGLAAVAASRLALAESEVVGATSTLAAAETALSRSNLAVAAAQRAHEAALITTDAALKITTADTLRLAIAQQGEAATAVQAARAQAAHTGSLLGLGSATSRLDAALLGLRTAVGSAAVIGLGAGALAAIALGKAIRSAVTEAVKFEQQMNTLAATTGATVFEIEQASEAARQLGADAALPAVSATDAAEAITELSKAGLDLQNSIRGARGVLELAAAASIDNAAATELAASSLNAFNLSARDATRVADGLAGASIAAQGSITDMGVALQQSAAAASQVGLTFETTLAFLTELARNGLRASDAGTSLRVALLRLAAPTKEARAELQALGVNVRDLQGNINPDVFLQLAAGLEQLVPAARDAALQTIFGNDAFRAASILAREGTRGFLEASDAVSKQGQAAELAAAKSEGLAGAWDRLKSGALTLGQSVAEGFTPLAEVAVEGLADTVEAANAADKALAQLGARQIDTSEFQEVLDRFAALNVAAESLREQDVAFQPSFTKELEDVAELLQQQMAPALVATTKGVGGLSTETADATSRQREFGLAALDVADAVGRMGAAVAAAGQQIANAFKASLQQAAKNLAGQAAGLQQQVVESQIADDPAAERAALDQLRQVLQRRREKLEAIIREGGAGAPTALRQLREDVLPQLRAVIASIASIDEDAVAEANRNARETEKRAKDIADARRQASQAIVDALGPDQTRADNQIARAALTETLADDIKANQTFRDILLAQLELVRRTVTDAKVKAAAIARLTQQLFDVQLTLRRLRQEQAEQARADAEAARQRRDDILQARIELAEATGNRQAEIAARKARIKELQDQIRAAKGDTLRILQLRTEIARERQALKDLQDEVEERGRAFQELSFSFLQAQQGFAASLLGNLIPGGATAGLVGNASPAGPQLAPLRPQGPQAGVALEAGLAQARDTGGVTQGQFAVLIDLTRQLVRILSGVRTDNQAPEARYNLAVQKAIMDTGGQTTTGGL